MGYRIDEIEGIGPSFKEKLGASGIETTDDLLKQCASKKGRDTTSQKTGVSVPQLLKFANMADLMRVSGVARQNAELLMFAGVDTIKELRTRKAENLAAKIKAVNDEKKLAKISPSASAVQKWIDAAKDLEPMITH
jgi:predicted flap endonuclease-1-like 5' DNA nuclease